MKLVRGNSRETLLSVNRVWYKPVLAMLCLLFTYAGVAQNIPARPDPPRLVNDFAHVMSPDQVQQLETKLDRYNDSTSTQIAVVTVENLGGDEIGSYAAELGEKWGVGTKQNHNGIIILMAKQEHKVTIRTGYGVEEKLGAIICSRIIANKLTPNFKTGNFYAGFDAATDEMMQRLAGTYKGNEEVNENPGNGISLWKIIAIIVFLFVVLPIFFRGGGGGGGTFGGGGFTGGLIGGIIGGALGGGGFGGGGGGGDSGGFGGFGGGGFSGGGASGDW